MRTALVSGLVELSSDQRLFPVCLDTKGEWLAALPSSNGYEGRTYFLYPFLSKSRQAEGFSVVVEFSSVREIDEATVWKPLVTLHIDQLVRGRVDCEVPASAAYIRLRLDSPDIAVPVMMLSAGVRLSNQEAYDRWATMRFCQLWGVPFDKEGRILEHDKPPTQSLNYSVIRCPSSAYGSSEVRCPTALHIRSLGRFSNALFQVAQACELASTLKIHKVYISPSEQTSQLFGKHPQIKLSGSSIQIFIMTPPKTEIVLEGTFFYSYRHKAWFGQGNRRYHFIQKFKSSMDLLPQSPLPKNECVIHIRSGDIFGDRPHPGYAQPPLAYYQTVIEHARVACVHLVYEDTSNPVIQPLQRYLTTKQIPYKVQSSDVRADIKSLLKGRIVVAGRGTFVPGVLAMSEVVEVLYTYDAPLQSVVLPNVSNVVIHDAPGIYRYLLLRQNWRNKAWQRQLMRIYPRRFLRPLNPVFDDQ